MRLRLAPRTRENTPMTAMIDVVFLLLVFFVWTASFRPEELLLPSSVAAVDGVGDATVELDLPMELEAVVVRVVWSEGQPRWIVNERFVKDFAEVQQIITEVASLDVNVPLIVEPEAEVPLSAAVRVYDAARGSGFARVHFAVSNEE